MKKVLALNGSPRAEGYSSILLHEVLRGVESEGGAVRVYTLNDPGFRGCQGCFYCRSHPTCPVKDMFQSFYDEIIDAVGVVFGSGIYFADITGQAKMGLDRLFPMLGGKSFTPRYPGKKVVTVMAQGDDNPERFGSALQGVNNFFQTFGWQVTNTFLAHGASQPSYVLPKELRDGAFAAGKQLIAG